MCLGTQFRRGFCHGVLLKGSCGRFPTAVLDNANLALRDSWEVLELWFQEGSGKVLGALDRSEGRFPGKVLRGSRSMREKSMRFEENQKQLVRIVLLLGMCPLLFR